MFFSYIVHDTVEIEPVYLPNSAPTTTTTHTLSCAATHAETSSPCTSSRADAGHITATRADRPPAPTSSSSCSCSSAGPYARTFAEVVLHRITERYTARIIPGKGLCVAVAELLDLSHCEVKGMTASAWVDAVFELCVFCPSPGTRIYATIASQRREGLSLTVGLLVHLPIFIPAAQLVEGSVFDEVRGEWFFAFDAGNNTNNDGDGDGGAASPSSSSPLRNYYVNGEVVVAAVTSCVVRTEEEMKQAEEISTRGGAVAPPLMEMVASFVGDGLGPTSWFDE